jgi:transposase
MSQGGRIMRRRHEISDADWERIEQLLPGQAGHHGGVAEDNRLFINAVLWIARTGAPWRDLPERFGKWNSVWRRFDRWSAAGVWSAVMVVLRDEDLEWLILDSTTVRAHPAAAGAKKSGTAPAAKATKPWAGVAADSARKSTAVSAPWVIPSS